jgi:hypothetical protein
MMPNKSWFKFIKCLKNSSCGIAFQAKFLCRRTTRDFVTGSSRFAR